ncbi:hypothetical protein ACWC5C_03855 [Streptomyces sp. NPDC001700]
MALIPNAASSSSLKAKADQILADSLADPLGSMTATCYDTAHLVRLWTRSADPRIGALAMPAAAWLLRSQNPDGSWGAGPAPAGYRFVPTLAAVSSLLAVSATRTAGQLAAPAGDAARRGLLFLTADPHRFGPAGLPDTVAIELIVPSLLEEIYEALEAEPICREATGAARTPTAPMVTRTGIGGLLADHGPWRTRLDFLRQAARQGLEYPPQLACSLEIFDTPPATVPAFTDGHIGCSPSATAAALEWTDTAPEAAAVDYLERAADRHKNGSLQHLMPLATFERAWIASTMLRLGIAVPKRTADQLAAYFTGKLASGGVAMGPGLPEDADITSTMIFSTHKLGLGADPACLFTFEREDCFTNYPQERTPSVTTNAHILEALGSWCERTPAPARRYAAGLDKARAFLLATQRADGAWDDKWHSSPCYATYCAALALHTHGGTDARPAVERAAQWITATQHDDGSWGVWCPTLDETAHALHLLLSLGRPAHREAIHRAAAFLAQARDAGPADPVRTPLWHGKELYEPPRIIDALIASVLHRYHSTWTTR